MSWPFFARRVLHAPDLIIRAGRSTKYPSHSWGKDGRDLGCHGVLILERGSGRYRDGDGRNEAVRDGALFLLFPGLRHEYGPGPGERWEESFVDCDGALPLLLERQGLLDRRRPLLRPGDDALRPLRLLIAAVESGRLADPAEAQWRLHGALLAAARAAPADDARLEAGRAALEAEPGRAMDPRAAADAAGMGWELFRKRFRARYGVPPARYRIHARCEAAAMLLLRSASDVDAVAAATGFCDGAHLRRHFRRAMGMPPETFRRLHRG